MELALIYMLVYFIESIILSYYCVNMFYSRYNKVTAYGFAFLLYAFLFLIRSSTHSYLNLLSFFTINCIYIFFLYYSKWYTALFHAAITTCLMGLSEVIIANFIPNLVYNFFDESEWLKKALILAVFSKFLYFLLVQTIIHICGKTKEQLLNLQKSTLMLAAISLFSIWIIITLMSLCMTIRLPLTLQIFITISALLLLVINFLIFSIYRYNRQKEGEYTAMRLQLQKEYDAVEYYQMLLAEEENKSILLHDIKKHLSTLSLLNQQGAYDKMGVYIENLLASPALQPSVKICDSDLLNAILFRYIRAANEKKISLHADIRSNSLSFLSNDDLTTLFCNLLDNAMDAVLQTEDGSIELCVQSKTFTVITLTNTCRINPYDAHGALPTRKADKLHHGYGLKSIARIVEKYCGSMKNYYDRETCTFHTIIMLKNTKKTTR